ncbi:hypothetical protein DXG01_008410, partial [Tephrocybe rancida]
PFKDLNDPSRTTESSIKVLEANDKMLLKQLMTTTHAPGPSLSSANHLLSLYADYAQSMDRTRLTHTIANLSASSLHLAYLLAGNVYPHQKPTK